MSDIALSLRSYFLRIGATGCCGLLTGGKPGFGGIPGPGPLGAVLPPPLSFLNLLFILNQNNFSRSLFIHPITPRATSIRIISSHIHHDEPSSESVFVRQQTSAPSQEYDVTDS